MINQVHLDDPILRYGLAGGGLVRAVALAEQARGGPRPAFHVAISPWTDLCVRNPGYAANAAVAPIITKAFSEYAAKLYLGDHIRRPTALGRYVTGGDHFDTILHEFRC